MEHRRSSTAGGKRKTGLSNNQAQEIMSLTSTIAQRYRLATVMGKQFDGRRDMYHILGYPLQIDFLKYMEKYTRQDICGRIVDLPANDTWRRPPVIKDGDEDSSQPDPKSPFLLGLKYLVSRRQLWHYLQRLDRLTGIGRYGVLMIGTTGIDPLDKPVLNNSLKTHTDVIYFSVFSEGSSTITNLVDDPHNERFGLPESYTLQMGTGLKSETVHWSRTLHVVEDPLEDEIYGRPRLERVFNRLEDLLKLIGGGSEATWKNMDRGLHADVREGFVAEEDDQSAMQDEIEDYINGLQRFIRTQGVDIKPLGSDVVDPTGLFGAIIGLIAAAADIPQRILLGSERGELASSQDQATWGGRIASRQTSFAEPFILRPLIDRLIAYGVLPAPKSGSYQVKWLSLFEMSDKEKAETAEKIANAVAKIAPAGATDLVIGPDEFRERVMGWPKREIEASLLNQEDEIPEDLNNDPGNPDKTGQGA